MKDKEEEKESIIPIMVMLISVLIGMIVLVKFVFLSE